jgi:DNA-directed RNA polymerase subunit RPC12/RpoP
MAGVDAGERVPCPSCGEVVLQKAMIPVLGPDGAGMSYLCVTCARALVVKRSEAQPGGPEAVGGGGGGAAGGGAAPATGLPPPEPAQPAPA